ncbi:MAG: RtcB family protein [Candidatus Nanohaloarchaea archaeon]|nr:RtcB family protein [Candidatus Nanohaloarchaea archaeon]
MAEIDLEQVSENIWEIPKEGKMRVPTRVFASSELLKHIKQDRTLEQAKNITEFPGIQKYACVLPDAHQGYGMPVGGVTALSTQNGGISPGAIGFDINCLTGDSEMCLEFGRRVEIRDLEDRFAEEKAIVAADNREESDIQLFMQKKNQTVFEIEAETGEKIRATADHPFFTPEGKKKLGELKEGDELLINPFKGIEDEEPEEFVVVNEEDFEGENPQIIRFLKDRDLLPLKSTDRKFNILLKLAGFHTGDGSFNNHGETSFYAEKEDLKKIQEDIEKLGIKASKIYSRTRNHSFKGNQFERTEHMVKATSRAFQKLLIKLGVPKGRKSEMDFTLPSYMGRLAGWQKALYLSAFFGAEMSAPSAVYDKNMYCPKISQNRIQEHSEQAKEFMQEIKRYLKELGVEANKIEAFEADSPGNPEMMRFRLGVKSDSENLIEFFTKIGYRYNLKKQKKAIKATQYLKTKEKAIERRKNLSKEAVTLYENGDSPQKIKQQLEINNRFIERSIYSGRATSPRPPKDFPNYEEYAERIEVKDNLSVKTCIKKIREKGKEDVYDIGVTHPEHNFIADSFVVSNCGVRVLKTDLKYSDIKQDIDRLSNILAQKIPRGLGKGSVTGALSEEEIEDVCRKGMKWALEEGYAVEEDLEHCEDNGFREGAETRNISEKAKGRARHQLGSLGSGNHFLAVQRVSDIYDRETAKQFGLKEDQVVVMIHCGSRGLGHQVCQDYVRKIEKEHPEVIKEMPDKQLAYAPAGSKLADEYYSAMNSAINFAWANRQILMHQTRKCFERIFGNDWDDMGMDLLYDVAHNIGKKEVHEVNGEEKELYVHRKGATRAFPAGREEVPEAYRSVGQPVLIPGSMGTSSYILKGTEKAMEQTFGSSAHGAGRLMSRTQAKQDFYGRDVQKDLKKDEIIVKAESGSSIAEEAPGVYKDVDEVVRVTDAVGIGDKVARTRPIINIIG